MAKIAHLLLLTFIEIPAFAAGYIFAMAISGFAFGRRVYRKMDAELIDWAEKS